MLYKGIETLHTFYDDYSSSTVNCALEKKYWGVASASSPVSKECCPCLARVEEQWICWAFGKPIHHGHYTRSTICMVSRSSSNKFLLAIHFARRQVLETSAWGLLIRNRRFTISPHPQKHRIARVSVRVGDVLKQGRYEPQMVRSLEKSWKERRDMKPLELWRLVWMVIACGVQRARIRMHSHWLLVDADTRKILRMTWKKKTRLSSCFLIERTFLWYLCKAKWNYSCHLLSPWSS